MNPTIRPAPDALPAAGTAPAVDPAALLTELGSAEPGPDERSVVEDLLGRLITVADEDGHVDIAYRTMDSPLGELLIAAAPSGVVRLAFSVQGHARVLDDLARRISPRVLRMPWRLDPVAFELDEYFNGLRTGFTVPVDLQLAHGFQRAVLEALGTIGYGSTAGYAAVAEAAGSPRAARAVGTACARNPVPILVPCHRVTRSDGSLGGYIAGPAAKRLLLDLESRPAPGHTDPPGAGSARGRAR